MADLQRRLKDLSLEAPGDLAERAQRAALRAAESSSRAGRWQTAGALAIVALAVVTALMLTGHPDPRIFSNISAGLGT